MKRSEPRSWFYVSGGTLRHDAPSYVERQADQELLEGLLRGDFCYVLTSRQMGKSSLMVRTARRLREQGVHTAIVDLTRIGTSVDPESWYLGIVQVLKNQLELTVDPQAWWDEHANIGVVQ